MSATGIPQPFAHLQQVLRERLLVLLASLAPQLKGDVERALQEPGKLLSSSSSTPSSSTLPAGTWSLLTLLVAQHVRPDIPLTVPTSVAVVVECFLCALDLLDDIEDNDDTPIVRQLGPARVLNTSTALLALAHQALLSLQEQDVPFARILHLLTVLEETSLTATGGQHRDLLAEQQSVTSFTQQECEAIAENKAGSLMRLACLLGALCAGAEPEHAQLFAEMGMQLGIAHQLDNDAHDLEHELSQHSSLAVLLPVEAKKTDLARGKKTLPVVLAAQALPQENCFLADEEKQEISLQALSDGIITTWGICLLYYERAQDCLRKIEAKQSISPALRDLLGFT